MRGELAGLVATRYPDLPLVTETLRRALSLAGQAGPGDGKWRPLPLLLAVLYRLQARAGDRAGTEVQDGTGELLELLGYHWHCLAAAARTIRPGLERAESREVAGLLRAAAARHSTELGLPPGSVVWVWSSELDRGPGRLENHTPDHLITVHPTARAVILTILGTRLAPAPEPLDILMDLAAASRPFYGGVAHDGLGLGAASLVRVAVPRLARQLQENPGYRLLITGYSLGAGLAQLLSLQLRPGGAQAALMPPNTQVSTASISLHLKPPCQVFTIGFGSPPVFLGGAGPLPDSGRMVLVQNDQDGIFGASLRNVKDLLLKAAALERLNLNRRLLLKMVFTDDDDGDKEENDNFSSEEIEFIEFRGNYSDHTEWIFEKEAGSIDDDDNDGFFDVSDEVWDEVGAAVENIPAGGEPRLRHLVPLVLRLQRQETGQVDITSYRGLNETKLLSDRLTLSSGMLNDHMPWGYDSLFAGLGALNTTQPPDLAILDRLGRTEHRQAEHNPGVGDKLRSRWGKFKTKVKDFIQG